jgi:hypothetical protein
MIRDFLEKWRDGMKHMGAVQWTLMTCRFWEKGEEVDGRWRPNYS